MGKKKGKAKKKTKKKAVKVQKIRRFYKTSLQLRWKYKNIKQVKQIPDETKEPEIKPKRKENDIKLNIRLPNWNFLDFTMDVTATTPLFLVKKKIVERFGPLRDLELFVDSVAEDNKVEATLETSLEECNIVDKKKGKEFTIYIDYKPKEPDNTLLLVNTALSDAA